MKYSEFKAEVEKLGFFVDIDNAPLYVNKAKGGETLIAIGKHKRFSVDQGWSGFHNLSENEQLAIYNLAHALAITPPAERDEEKRYQLRKIPVPLLGEGKEDLWYCQPNHYWGRPTVDRNRRDDYDFQTIFTESEIAKMDITGFEKVEVTE